MAIGPVAGMIYVNQNAPVAASVQSDFQSKLDMQMAMNAAASAEKKKEVEDDTKLEVIIWPQPYCYAKTPEENKQRTTFEFSPAGVEQAADWLNEQYELQRPLWELSKKLNIV